MNNVDETKVESTSFEKILEIVKEHCYITSNEPHITSRITNIVKAAINTIASKIGISQENVNSFDFLSEKNYSELLLLCDYCLYKWNNKTDKEFEQNYISTIISLRAKQEVKSMKKEEEVEDNG